MEMIGKQIASFRKQRSITQEDLARLVGISPQAVSKWETGGAPDVLLLPAIADALEVSIDQLFGRNRGTADLPENLMQFLHSIPKNRRFHEICKLAWVMQNALFHEKDGGNADAMKEGYSHILEEDGLSLLRINGLANYFFAAELCDGNLPEKQFQKEGLATFFSLLGQENGLRTLLLIYQRGNGPFTAKFAAKQLSADERDITELLERFCGFHLLMKETICLDDEEITVYRSLQNPAFVPFITFAQELIDEAEKPYVLYAKRRVTPLMGKQETP